MSLWLTSPATDQTVPVSTVWTFLASVLLLSSVCTHFPTSGRCTSWWNLSWTSNEKAMYTGWNAPLLNIELLTLFPAPSYWLASTLESQGPSWKLQTSCRLYLGRTCCRALLQRLWKSQLPSLVEHSSRMDRVFAKNLPCSWATLLWWKHPQIEDTNRKSKTLMCSHTNLHLHATSIVFIHAAQSAFCSLPCREARLKRRPCSLSACLWAFHGLRFSGFLVSRFQTECNNTASLAKAATWIRLFCCFGIFSCFPDQLCELLNQSPNWRHGWSKDVKGSHLQVSGGCLTSFDQPLASFQNHLQLSTLSLSWKAANRSWPSLDQNNLTMAICYNQLPTFPVAAPNGTSISTNPQQKIFKPTSQAKHRNPSETRATRPRSPRSSVGSRPRPCPAGPGDSSRWTWRPPRQAVAFGVWFPASLSLYHWTISWYLRWFWIVAMVCMISEGSVFSHLQLSKSDSSSLPSWPFTQLQNSTIESSPSWTGKQGSSRLSWLQMKGF